MRGSARSIFRGVFISSLIIAIACAAAFGASIMVPPQCTDNPSLGSVAPQTVSQGQMNVSLTLMGRDLDKTSVALDFGAGITVVGKPVAGTSITDVLKTYTVTINVAPTAQTGQHFISIRYCNGTKILNTQAFITVLAGQKAVIPDGLVIVAPGTQCTDNPMVSSANPQILSQGQSNVQVMLAGRDLDKPGVTLDFGAGIIVLGPAQRRQAAMDMASYAVTLNVLPAAPFGPHFISVRFCNGSKTMQTQSFVTVVPGRALPSQLPLSLTHVLPNIWEPGKTYQLTLNGTNLVENMEVQFGEGVKSKGVVKVFSPVLAQMEVEVDLTAKGQRNAQVRTNLNQNWNQTQAAVTIKEPKKLIIADVGPLCQPLEVDFTKGTLQLQKPKPYVEDPDHAKTSIGAPLLNDAVRFEWREMNPGLADYYDFNIMTLDGTLLKTVRLNSTELELMGMKFKLPPQTFFHPDAAFIKEIMNLLPPPPSAAEAINKPVTGAQSAAAKTKTGPSAQKAMPSAQAAAQKALPSSQSAKAMPPAAKDPYPAETKLLWEVVGFREFKSDCGFTSAAKKTAPAKSSSTVKTSVTVKSTAMDSAKDIKPVLPAVQKDEKLVLEVEHSDRWPLSIPEKAGGITACPSGGKTKGSLQVQNVSGQCIYKLNKQTQKWECEKETVNGQVVNKVDPNNYPGDDFKMSGSFSLDRSPYAPQQEMKDPPPPPPGGINTGMKVGTGNFLNLVVDWGDGEFDSVVHPVHLNMPPFERKDKGSYGSLVTQNYEIEGLHHKYQKVGSYNVRVYMLSDDDMQVANVNTLAQSVDKNSKNPYLKLASLGLGGRASQTSTLQSAARTQTASDIASRAYVLFCKVVDIRPVEDTDATGPLHLDWIDITGFPGHDSGQGTCGIVAQEEKNVRTAVPAALTQPKSGLSSRAASLPKSGPSPRPTVVAKSSNIKAIAATASPALGKLRSSGSVDATATTCDEFLTAEGALGYYGQGDARISWMREGTVVRQEEHHVMPSEQRQNLDRNPEKWPAPIISTDSTIPNSGNLIEDTAGKSLGNHKVTVDAMVVVKPSLSNIGMFMERALDSPSLGQRMSTVFSKPGPGGAAFKAGFISPYKVNTGGAPPVIYGNGAFSATATASIAQLILTKPNYVASEPATYAIKESDPKQACTFIFADKDNGEFRISGLQGNVVQKGTTYSGCGTMLVPLTKSADGEPESYPVPIEFTNWSVKDGLHVDKGMKLSVSPKKTVSAPGVTGTLDKVEGTSGDEVKATLSLKLQDTLRLAGGTEKPHEWTGKSSRLMASGDWYLENQVLPDTFIGWSAFKIKSDKVTLDLSRAKSAGAIDPLCGSGGNKWVGVHLGDATLTPYTFDLVATGGWTSPTVPNWAIIDEGICGKAYLNKPYNAKVDEGTVHFDALDVNSSKGTFTAIYKNMIVHVPWLDADLKGDATLTYSGGGDKGISLPLSGKAGLKDYTNIKMQADKLAFTKEENIGWTVKSDAHFEFSAEGKKFSSFDVPALFFGLDGRAYFAKGGTSSSVSLGGPTVLGKTAMDLVSVDLDTSKGGSDRLKFSFNAKIHLSKKIPDADVRVLYSIARTGANYFGTGPFTGPFEVNIAFPPGQPTVEANMKPNYTGPSGGSAGLMPRYALMNDDGSSIADNAWKPGEQYALDIPGSYDIALFGSGDGDRFNGALDLAMFGGPPVKAEFRLGYIGGDDYWLTRATIGLGTSGVTLTPYLTLYAIRGGLGYNFPINAFSSVDSLSAVAPDMSGTYMFMAGMRVGAPTKFAYMLDGDFTVKLGVGARMDYRAWLMTNDNTGEGTFHGYFQYASGNFDGMLAGKINLMGDAVYMEIPENAATMHFGGGTWRIAAGKREGPRIKAHLLIQDVNGFLEIGNEGLFLGGNMTYKLNAGIGYISGVVDGGLEITPPPHIAGYLEGSFSAKICAYDVCIGPSLSAGVNMSALPVSVGAHACFEIPIPFWNPEVCGSFSL